MRFIENLRNKTYNAGDSDYIRVEGINGMDIILTLWLLFIERVHLPQGCKGTMRK